MRYPGLGHSWVKTLPPRVSSLSPHAPGEAGFVLQLFSGGTGQGEEKSCPQVPEVWLALEGRPLSQSHTHRDTHMPPQIVRN